MSKRNRLQRLLLMLAGSLAGLLACELALRVADSFLHVMDRYQMNLLYQAHPIWDHQLRPGFSIAARLLDPKRYSNPFLTWKINSLGCRDSRELALPKPGGVRRILVLGDSFTEGLRQEDSVAASIERRLNGSEVINCGCVSHSPLMYYLRLKHQLLSVSPDVVVMNVDLTDIYDDYWRYRPSYEFSADGEVLYLRNPARAWNRVLAWSVVHSDVARVVYAYRGRLLRVIYGPLARLGIDKRSLGIAPTEAELFAYHSTLPVESQEWKTETGFCLDNISRIARLLKAHRVLLIVTTYPHREQLLPGKSGKLWNRAFEQALAVRCRDLGVEFYSAFDGIARAVREGQPIFFEDDMHFRPEGQRVWGPLVAAFVKARIEGP